jgi:hypothetical protein
MARAIIGGLGFSTLTSLLLVPWTYALIDDAGRWVRRLRRRASGHAAGASGVPAPLRE